MALVFCLGKLHTAISRTQANPSNMDTAKSIVFHQAALQSNPGNFRSANELGVLLAQVGQLEQATDLFKQSLVVQHTPAAWRNLAKTHQRLGQVNYAQLAEAEFSAASQVELASSSAGIYWLPVQKFNAMAPAQFPDRVASNPATQLPPSAAAVRQDESYEAQPSSFTQRLKQLF